jgi:hypothetical protein
MNLYPLIISNDGLISRGMSLRSQRPIKKEPVQIAGERIKKKDAKEEFTI